MARGLLQDDYEWKACLREAKDIKTGQELRNLFCIILRDCAPTSPDLLWNEFKLSLSDDLQRRLVITHQFEHATQEDACDYGLYLIWMKLKSFGFKDDAIILPPPDFARWSVVTINAVLNQTYNREQQSELASQKIPLFNDRQKQAFDAIIHSIDSADPKLFFLHGPAGTGKTFVYNTLCQYLRGQGKIVLCVASSGIASQLLDDGRTAHSMFRIPLNVDTNESATCDIKKQSPLADLLRNTDCIIWDEIPMQNRRCQEAVDQILRDIRNSDLPMGGITTVDGGDFQQILPVVVRGGRGQIVQASLRRSYLWEHMNVLHLTENKRLEGGTEEDRQFADWLLDVGRGLNNDQDGLLQLPESMRCGETIEDLINAVYPNIAQINPTADNDDFFKHRTILSARNDDVNDVNAKVLTMMPGVVHTCLGSDRMVREDGADGPGGFEYPVEFLNTINPAGMPPAKLDLKVGAPLMILRNLDPKEGICNGTRVVLTKVKRRVLEVRILGSNQTALLPRIKFKPTSSDQLPFEFVRQQFPVKLAYAMTINKSQGQSVKKVGLDLRTPVFTHGQLYVGLSRCTSPGEIKVLLNEHQLERFKTHNIVWPEVLLAPE